MIIATKKEKEGSHKKAARPLHPRIHIQYLFLFSPVARWFGQTRWFYRKFQLRLDVRNECFRNSKIENWNKIYTQRKRYFSLNFDIKLDQKLYLVVLGNLPSFASISDLRGLLFCCQSAARRTESEWQIGDTALVDTIPFCFSLPKLLILWYETRSSKMNVADKLMKCVNSPK